MPILFVLGTPMYAWDGGICTTSNNGRLSLARRFFEKTVSGIDVARQDSRTIQKGLAVRHFNDEGMVINVERYDTGEHHEGLITKG